MKFIVKLLVSLLLILPIMPRCLCQSIREAGLEGITRRTWRIQNGLPDQVINSLAVTPDHYLWLGTPRNLLRFDGFHFRDASGKAASLIHDFGITSLYAAGDGSLWAGTGGGTLLHFAKGQVRVYGQPDGLNGYNVQSVQEDANGVLWAGTEHGIYRFIADRFVRVSRIKSADPSVRAMIPDGSGGLWIAGHHLIHYSNGAFQLIPLPKQNVPTRIETLALGPNHTLWIGTLGGLLRMDDGKSVTAVPTIHKGITSLRFDRSGRFWIGTIDDGIYVQGANGKFVHFGAATEGVSEAVLAFAMDESGDVWAGTQSGLVRLSDTGIHLAAIPEVRNSEYATVALDWDNSLWIAAGKILHLTGAKVTVARLPLVGDVPVRSIFRDRAGALWIGTAGEGAIRIPRAGHAERYAAIIGTSYITGFLQGADDDVWISTESGVAVWHNGAIITFQRAVGAPHQVVNCMALTGTEDLWLGTNHGLLQLRQGQFLSDPAIAQFGSHAVRALHGSADGTLWIGTESGLYRLKNQRLQHVPLEYGNNKAILSILEDEQDRLWLGSLDTVRRIDRAAVDRVLSTQSGSKTSPRHASGEVTDSIIPETFAISSETGAALYGGLQSSSASDGRGGAWFISDAGAIHIGGATRRVLDSAPPIVLDRVVVDGQEVRAGDTITLPPSTKTLEIEATPVVLSSHTGLRIRRRLIGFDESWNALPASHIATYTNLPAGSYTYRVEAFWPDQQAKSVFEIRIVQRAHFYETVWFISLCVAFLLLLAWFAHRLKLQQISARFAAVAEERNRVAREMHDTLLQGCIGVSLLLDGIDSTQRGADRGNGWMRALSLARAEIEKTIREARAAIWNLRQTETEAHFDRALRELVEKMTKGQGIPVTFTASGPSLRIMADQRHEILLAMREALRNAMRHANPTRIAVNLWYTGSRVKIEIADDGSGLPADSRGMSLPGHFGIIGMRERMARIGGGCEITSKEGVGTTVTLELPIHPVAEQGDEKA